MFCSCEEWEENEGYLADMSVLAWNHGMEYKGKHFKFCPWCGKKLKE